MAFAIPELRSHVATFLDTKDILSLTQTCRHWHQIWQIELFTVVVLHSPPSPYLLAMLGTYGHHVWTLKLKFADCGAHCAQILQLTPNTRSLDLYRTCLSEFQMEEIVFAAPARLRKLNFFLEQAGEVVRDELFVFLAHLRHLRTVSWASVEAGSARSIHVDDILLVLEACPQLTSLILGYAEITDSDVRGDGSIAAVHGVDPDTPHPCVGRRLHTLELNDCVVSDGSLLKLLGIRSSARETCVTHPLVNLKLNLMSGNTVTSRSVTSILQECRSLEALRLNSTNVVLAHIFQEGQVWPCAQSLRMVDFINKNRTPQGQLTSRDQELIRDHLHSLSKVEYVCIAGYPLGFVAVEEVEFAQSLRWADLTLEVEAPWDYFQEAVDAQLLAQGNRWIKIQAPRRWSCSIKRGPPVKYHLSYDRNQNPMRNVAVLL
ncbi:hypothetical protein BG006_008359 [Podila minutissima]|uniref:F-box domain-containing protein n=1 Tax=Podila minutissima TaxID=64525 RepID=A0A9P5SFZ5_9FUNG|nr:hypothetical protein BG006_008359 [Podila minutissima]